MLESICWFPKMFRSASKWLGLICKLSLASISRIFYNLNHHFGILATDSPNTFTQS